MIFLGFTWHHHGITPLLYCVLVDEVLDTLGGSDNDFSTYIEEEETYTSSFVIVSFSAKFTLSATLIMAAERKLMLLVGGSDTTYNTTYWWVSEGFPRVLKIDFYCILSGTLQ